MKNFLRLWLLCSVIIPVCSALASNEELKVFDGAIRNLRQGVEVLEGKRLEASWINYARGVKSDNHLPRAINNLQGELKILMDSREALWTKQAGPSWARGNPELDKRIARGKAVIAKFKGLGLLGATLGVATSAKASIEVDEQAKGKLKVDNVDDTKETPSVIAP